MLSRIRREHGAGAVVVFDNRLLSVVRDRGPGGEWRWVWTVLHGVPDIVMNRAGLAQLVGELSTDLHATRDAE